MLTVGMQMSAEARCWVGAGYSGFGGGGGKHSLAPRSAPGSAQVGKTPWHDGLAHYNHPAMDSTISAATMLLYCSSDGGRRHAWRMGVMCG